jgi:hypothetical protein
MQSSLFQRSGLTTRSRRTATPPLNSSVRHHEERALKSEIASLHERMSKGGDWRAFRDEIAALHEQATTEDEYVALLEAHRNLVAVGKFAYDEETYANLLPIAEAEYRMFLNKEAMEDGMVNPVLLESITRREVETGRLDPNDRELAASGASVLGDSAETTAHRCKQGDWFFYGMTVAALLSAAFVLIPISPLWLIAVGLVLGWFLNERERKRIKAAIAERRSAT